MKLAVISSASFIEKDGQYFAYSPYVKELAIWAKHADKVAFCCSMRENDNALLIAPLPFEVSRIFPTKEFNVKSLWNLIKAIRYSFWNCYQLFLAMAWADHIHLRCPGNIGLMGCIVQIFFPGKTKTAKYAGNWAPNSGQPWSYRLQRWILSNTFLTHNMQVLVYGEWEGSSKNIKPFFTASYTEADKIAVEARNLGSVIEIMYVGILSSGKRPLYAIKLIEALRRNGIDCRLSLYGNGKEKENLERYIEQHHLVEFIFMKGNHPQEILKKAYQQSHFVLLPSESEGWPKVIAEGMFWGCLPIATKVSCVPNMLDNGNRGVLLEMDLEQDTAAIASLIRQPETYLDKVQQSICWSRKYTLDLFENEIKALLYS